MAKKENALGKGLSAIFGESIDDVLEDIQQGAISEYNSQKSEIAVAEIKVNPYQPRKHFDDDKLHELADSIKLHGVFTPILVKKAVQGYELITGERRWRATKLAGKTTIPAIVMDFNDQQMMEIALLENIQREDLNAIEEALGYEKLIALASEWHDATDTDPADLARMFLDFVRMILSLYGYITNIYCDSAEQVLIRGLESALVENELGNLRPRDALKRQITDRIFTLTTLTAKDRFLYTEDCETLTSAISMAVWNPKNTELERLDDGTSDIDSLDAFEYSYERDYKKYIKKKTDRRR